ncbi:hypothetical protein SCANM63S_08371 [Streptomyces canarius]
MTGTTGTALGAPAERREGRQKVTGAAGYAAEYTLPGRVHAWPVPAAVARGRVTAVDTSAALALPGVLAVLTPFDAPRLAEPEDGTLAVLQNPDVPHRGWCVALAVAETPETARAAARAVRVTYATAPHDTGPVEGHPGAYDPDWSAGGHPAGSTTARSRGRRRRGRGRRRRHRTGCRRCTTTRWSRTPARPTGTATGSPRTPPARAVPPCGPCSPSCSGCPRSGSPSSPSTSAAASAPRGPRARTSSSPRSPPGTPAGPSPWPTPAGTCPPSSATAPRPCSGCGSAPRDGRLTALLHDVTTHTSHVKEFVEYAGVVSRVMYATPNLRSVHHVVPLDVPTPSWMRAPGESPGMYALESAMDELADALGVDPVELRVRNEPERGTGQRQALQQPACRGVPGARAPAASAGPGATRAPASAARARC